jgi:UDP-N-acetylglucosamine acyltransferase
MIGTNVKFGRFCIIEKDVIIGNDVKIHNYVELREGTIVQDNVKLDSKVCVTGNAFIGRNTVVRNDVVIARGTEIGHDCFLAPKIMFNNLPLGDMNKKGGGAKIGNFVNVGTGVIFNHGITIADNVTIGSGCFIRKSIQLAGTFVNKQNIKKLEE